jgi:hypothetical protein
LTGFDAFAGELGAKRLALLHELVSGVATVGFLENPNNPASELRTRDVLAAAAIGPLPKVGHQPRPATKPRICWSCSFGGGVLAIRHLRCAAQLDTVTKSPYAVF